MTRVRLFLACNGLTLLSLLSPSHTLAQTTTGNIEGKVVGENGDPLLDVQIAARNPSTGVVRGSTSDRQGRYRLLGLPPGGYILRATLAGYGASPQETVVNIGQTVRLGFTMQAVSGLVEAVRVTGERPLLNSTSSELVAVVTEKEIQSYPLLNREFSDLAVLAPGVRQAPTGQSIQTKKQGVFTPFTTGGSDGHNLNISIDGADNNDNLAGLYLQGFPQDGIGEFEVIQDMPKAEYGRSSGQVINVITKSGTNDFSGSFFGIFRNQDGRAKSFSESLFGAEKQGSDRYQFGVSLGGPIVKDRLFYFLAAERQNETMPVGLNPAATQFAGTEPPGFPVQIATPGSSFQQNFDRDLWTFKLNWNPSSDHLLWVRYTRDDYDSTNDLGTSLTEPSANVDSRTRSWSATASWQWFLRPGMFNELRVSRLHHRLAWTGTSPQAISLIGDTFILGQSPITPLLIDEQKTQIRDDLTWVVGRHSLKSGFEAIPIHIFGGNQFTGTLPLVVFNPGIVPAATMASGDTGATNGTAANGVDDGIDILNFVWFLSKFTVDGRWTQYGAYIQDDWNVNDRLWLHLGLRVDQEAGLWDTEKGANRAFYECLADPANNAKCGRDPATTNPPRGVPKFQHTLPQDPLNISPRLGFVYNVGGGDTDVLRGSWGLFYDQVFGNNAAVGAWANNCQDCYPALPPLAGCDPSDLQGCAATTRLTAGTIVHPGLPPLPVDFTLNNWVNDPRLHAWVKQLDSSLRGATFDDNIASGLISPDFKANYNSSYSLGWGHAFNQGLALDVNAVYRRGYRQYRWETLGGRASGREAPWPAVTDPATGLANYGGFMNIFTSDGATRYDSLQVGLKGRYSRFDFGASLNVSRARGTQDNAGTGAVTADGGPNQSVDGGNIQFTGGPIGNEWGQISGDQRLYAFLHGIYRFPHGIQTAAQVAWGTKTAVHPFAGVDLNGDGFTDNEYSGRRGGGEGGDLFNINCRISKLIEIGKGTRLETFLDIFNLTNRDNYATFVFHRQFLDNGGQFQPNPDYLKPIGNTLTPPRTLQLGMKVHF